MARDPLELARTIGYKFQDQRLLHEALTHPSWLVNKDLEKHRSWQRLEFLGDKVVGFIVAQELFERFRNAREGKLTEYYSIIVSNNGLSVVGRRLKLGEYIKLGRAEENRGGRDNDYYIACAFEALAGAMSLDSLRGAFAVKDALTVHIFHNLEEVIAKGQADFDPKGRLQAASTTRYGKVPTYQVVRQERDGSFVVAVLVGLVPIAQGSGDTEKQAEVAAARNALAKTRRLTTNLPYGLIRSQNALDNLWPKENGE